MKEQRYKALKDGEWRIIDLLQAQVWSRELLQEMADHEVFAKFHSPLCQSTGLMMWDGTEVFDSDIIQFKTPRKQGVTKRQKREFINLLVVWREDKARFSAWVIGEQGHFVHLPDVVKNTNHKLIGNMYTHPQLFSN